MSEYATANYFTLQTVRLSQTAYTSYFTIDNCKLPHIALLLPLNVLELFFQCCSNWLLAVVFYLKFSVVFFSFYGGGGLSLID